MLTEVRYPNVEVRIWEAYPFVCYDDDADDEEDGDYSPDNPDAARVLARVRSALREGGAGDGEIEAYTREATLTLLQLIGYPINQSTRKTPVFLRSRIGCNWSWLEHEPLEVARPASGSSQKRPVDHYLGSDLLPPD